MSEGRGEQGETTMGRQGIDPALEKRLHAALRQWSAENADIGPPPQLEEAVLSELDRSMGRKRRRRWMLTFAAAAAALVIAVPSLFELRRSAVEPSPASAQEVAEGTDRPFVALPYVIQPARFERTEVVRMTVPLAELAAVGLSVASDPSLLVEADVVVGQDGRARAVRLPAIPE